MENQGQSFAYLYHQALVNPKEVSLEDFNALLAKYPYSQPLHFALERRKFLRSELNKLGNNAILLANSPNWLYEYVQLPVRDVPYVDVVDNDYVPYDVAESESVASVEEVTEEEVTTVSDEDVMVAGTTTTEEETTDDVIATAEAPVAEEGSQTETAIVAEESPVEATAEEAVSVAEEEREETKTASVVEERPEATTSEEEVPAVEKDIETEAVSPAEADLTAKSEEEEPALEETTTHSVAEISDEEHQVLETLVQEGIGGGDYFALHGKEIRWETNADSGEVSVQEEAPALGEQKNEDEEVSLYNDELMPYSFRWWLHKTRLEYADTYQPFASAYLPTNKKSAFDPVAFDKIVLDQQIRENIIHLQRPEDKLSDEVKQRAVTYTRVDKTSEVIEKFIREEPQIQPPPADQLNMENKARKSSEEQFDLVTETLATIYASQAMYVKAIEVYKKLILKYPEKKSYFATQIKTLEEKLY